MVLIRGIYGVVYSTIIIGMFRYIIIIIYEVPTFHCPIRWTKITEALETRLLLPY